MEKSRKYCPACGKDLLRYGGTPCFFGGFHIKDYMENKCCEKCRTWDGLSYLKEPKYNCYNTLCPCHTSPKELPKGVCPSCWGKKFNSVMTRQVGYPDFPGDKGFDTGSYVDNIPCSKCNGTGLFPLPKEETYCRYGAKNCFDHPFKEECNHEIGIAGGKAYCKKCGLEIDTSPKEEIRYKENINCDNAIVEIESPKEEVNFLRVGETIACGHCDERFKEGFEQAEKTGYFKTHKCNCICHSPKEEIVNDWESEYRKEFNKIWEPLFDVSSWKEVGNKAKDFNIKYISSIEKRVEKEFNEKLEKVIRTMERNNDIIFKQNIEDIIKLGEKLKQSIDNAVPHSQHKFAILGRNNAIEDYQNLIKSKYE